MKNVRKAGDEDYKCWWCGKLASRICTEEHPDFDYAWARHMGFIEDAVFAGKLDIKPKRRKER